MNFQSLSSTSKLFSLLMLLLSSGCVEQELPIPVHEQGVSTTSSVGIGSNYAQRVYFDLASATVVASHKKMDWDLAFSASATGPAMRINTSRFCRLARTEITDFNASIDSDQLSDFPWEIDAEEGPQFFSAAAPQGDLLLDELLLLNLGYDLDNAPMGFIRLILDSVDLMGYHIRFAPLETPELVEEAVIPYSADRHWQHYSLMSSALLPLEPALGQWQLLFTQYTAVLNGETPYLVTGVLTPNTSTLVCDMGSTSVKDVLEANWDLFQWSSQWNAIGYDWKSYDFNLGAYSVDTERSYAIRTGDEREFVLQFVDFYDDAGARGYMTFSAVER